MIKKRGKGWLIKVYLGRDSEGKKKYYTETFYAPLKSMAQARERELKQKFEKLGPKQGVATLGEWLDVWLEEKHTQIDSNSYRTYTTYINKIKPFIADVKTYEISGPELKRRINGHLDNVAPRTQRNILNVLKTAIRTGIEARVIPQDALLGFGTVKIPRKDRPVLTREALYRLIKASEPYRYGLVIRLLVVTGARLGEILGLTWDRIDFVKNAITIDRTVDVLDRLLKDDTKTPNSRRSVIRDAETMTKLLEWRKKSQGKVVSMQNKDLVFRSSTGKSLHYGRMYKMFKAVLKKAELPDMRIHDIRHAVVTLLLSEGVPAVTVASLVGHNVATTNAVYAEKIRVSRGLHLASESQKE